MYESPIDISYSDMILKTMNEMSKKWNQESDNHVMACVNQFVKVDKDELIRALQYDRGQYEKGYEDGKRDAVRHGYWIRLNRKSFSTCDSFWQCSECRHESIRVTDYCPFCGAEMAAKEDE